VDAGGTVDQKIMSTYPIFRLLVVRSDGAVHPLGERPRPARFRVAEPGAFLVSSIKVEVKKKISPTAAIFLASQPT
jgi:hypothetical protein